MIRLNNEQRNLVNENIKLVHKVLHDKVHGAHQLGIFTYDDLFQIGCIGLCKAAATDKGGVFSTYAYRLIWNEICSAIEYASKRSAKELSMDPWLITVPSTSCLMADIDYRDLDAALNRAEKMTTGVTSKGIHALRLKAKGYNSREIGEKMGAPANHVTAWIAKARTYLRSNPQFLNYT